MSIIRPTQRLRPNRILIALAAGVALAALVPAAAGAGNPPTHHLEFRLSGSGHQDVIGTHAIVVNARCQEEDCTVVASASAKKPAVHSATVRAHIEAGAATTISMPLAPRQRGRLKAALEAGESPTLTVKAVAHDHSGNKVPLTFEVHARKP